MPAMPVESNVTKAIFLAALEKATPAERTAYLEEVCAGDDLLRQRVRALLQAHDLPDPLLDQPAARHLAAEDDTALDFLEPPATPDSLGRLGHYQVLEVIGRGGMGIVLRAFDDKLHRVVAIKVLAPSLASNGLARQRFVREARAMAAVIHDNVIAIHEVEDGGPVPYLVMQFIGGGSLQEKLERTGPLPVQEILRLGLQIAEGLAAAHGQGLVHRDIKPANILLENDGVRVKITDFGLARAGDDASLTQVGVIAGTPAFMSPEQANGEPLDGRSDLFSLGCVLYALCTGRSPFQAPSSLAVLKRVCEETPPPIRASNPAIPAPVEATVSRLLAKAPAERFASAAEVAALLGHFLAQLQSGTDPELSRFRWPSKTSLQELGRSHLPSGEKSPVRGLSWTLCGLLAIALLISGWVVPMPWSVVPQESDHGEEPTPPKPLPAPPVALKPSRTLMLHTGAVRSLAFSPQGEVLASGGTDRCIVLLDTRSWQPRILPNAHSGEVSALAFTPDGRQLASATSAADTCLIRLWNLPAGQPARTLGGPGAGMWAVAFSPDGKTLACGGWDKTLHLFDPDAGTERLAVPNVAEFMLRVLSFSPDGKRIATGGKGPARLWDATSGQEVPTAVALPDWLYPIFLPGGQGLAGWNYYDGRVTLCELPSGKVRAAWRAHPGRIEGLALSPDGRFLASIGHDGVAKIWSTADLNEVATLHGHKGILGAAAFAPDGKWLATGGADDLSIRIWDLPSICHVRK